MSHDKRLAMNYTTAGVMPKRKLCGQLGANGHELAKKHWPIIFASTPGWAFTCCRGLKM